MSSSIDLLNLTSSFVLVDFRAPIRVNAFEEDAEAAVTVRCYMDGQRGNPKSYPERVCNGYTFNLLPMLHVFAEEGFTVRINRGGDNQAVVETKSVTGLYIEATPVKCRGWVNTPKRQQNMFQHMSSFLR